MADDRISTSAAGGARGYKRSWKNLLINKRYQLRFTLFMVLVSSALMAGLGWWVMAVADEATHVEGTGVRGENCPPMPKIGALPVDPGAGSASSAAGAPAPAPGAGSASASASGGDEADGDDDTDTATPVEPEHHGSGSASGSGTAISVTSKQPPAGADKPPVPPKEDGSCKTDTDCGANMECRDDGTCHHKVAMGSTSMTINPIPDGFAESVAAHYECEMRQASRLDDLETGYRRILWVLVGSCLLLVIGLAVYGIKMTHKVAGPLYKITLYMGKMRDGRYDKVYNLRKGDQLVDFYEHFKTAHAGVVGLEKADVDQLKAVLAAADEAKLAGTSPEIDAALGELRTMLERKEKALE